MERRDFFISYTKADRDWAVWIANVLIAHGYTVYIQALDIHPGDNFLEKMEEFLENSANFIAVWSKNYSKSDYCMQEFRAAFTACHAKEMGCLLPVRIEKHPLKRLYSSLVHADLFGKDKSAAESELIDAVEHATAHSEPKPEPDMREAHKLYQIGVNYYYGQNGVEQDYAKARDYYEQAAAKGNADALFVLGFFYNSGEGVKKDYVKALEYYKQAAAKGNAYALNNLGILYEYGYGVEQDYAKAREYYEQAAKTPEYCAKVREYYEQAAKKGNADALNNLGVFYEHGYSVEQNYHKALEYYQKAADAGVPIAVENVDRLREKLNN